MSERTTPNAELRGIEQLVRAAGDYLDVTDDLRPQTLERARHECRKTTTRFSIAVVAVIVVVLAFSASVLRSHLSSSPPLMAGAAADGDQLYAAALQQAAEANVDPSWSLVDAFRELQAPGQFVQRRLLTCVPCNHRMSATRTPRGQRSRQLVRIFRK